MKIRIHMDHCSHGGGGAGLSAGLAPGLDSVAVVWPVSAGSLVTTVPSCPSPDAESPAAIHKSKFIPHPFALRFLAIYSNRGDWVSGSSDSATAPVRHNRICPSAHALKLASSILRRISAINR